jgi:hypothetical protein
MKIKVSEASGPVLDWMVAKANGASADALESYVDGLRCADEGDYCTDWSQGGPIIETKIDCLRKRSKAEEASLAYPNPNFKFKAEIFADIDGYFCAFGPTPLIAGLRCFVVSRLGETVEVPEELT